MRCLLGRASRALCAFLGGAVLAMLLGSPATASVASTAATGIQHGVAYTYDTVAYVYDAPAALSSPGTVVAGARASPERPRATSWGSTVSVRGHVLAANTAGRAAASSTARVGPGASLENISASEALRIQNAANRIGEPISLVGSRASGTAGAYSDWDYVITGINGSTRHSVSSSCRGGRRSWGSGARSTSSPAPWTTRCRTSRSSRVGGDEGDSSARGSRESAAGPRR